jgi:hypothetical protein
MTNLSRVTPVSTRRGAYYEVVGSKGDTYVVDRNCTCPGFRYRRTCKHLDWVAEYQVKHQTELETDLQRKLDDLFR